MTMKKFGSPEPIAPDDQHKQAAREAVFSDEDRKALAKENAEADSEEQQA